MNLKIYKNLNTSNDVYLDLMPVTGGGVTICAKNQHGMILSNLITINSDGSYYVWSDIDRKLGFKLDSIGKLVLGTLPC